MLARFLAREVGELRPWKPLSRGQQRFWQLLKRRATLVRAKVQLRQSLADMGNLQEDADALLEHCVRMIAKLDRALLAQAKELGWREAIARCRAIPVLATFSRSGHVDAALFGKIVAGAAVDAGRDAQILERLTQPADHPASLHVPESEYLKGLILRVLG